MALESPPHPNADQKAERSRLQALDGAAARAEYAAAIAHEHENIARLRALRLERDRLAALQTATKKPVDPARHRTGKASGEIAKSPRRVAKTKPAA